MDSSSTSIIFEKSPAQFLETPLAQYLNADHANDGIQSQFVVRGGDVVSEHDPLWKLSWIVYEPSLEDEEFFKFKNQYERMVRITSTGIYGSGLVDERMLRYLEPFYRDDGKRYFSDYRVETDFNELIKAQMSVWFGKIDSELDKTLSYYGGLPDELRRYFLTVHHSLDKTDMHGVGLMVLLNNPAVFFKLCLVSTLEYLDRKNKELKEYNVGIGEFGIAQFSILAHSMDDVHSHVELAVMLDTATTVASSETEEFIPPGLHDVRLARSDEEARLMRQHSLNTLPNMKYYQASVAVRFSDMRGIRYLNDILKRFSPRTQPRCRAEHVLLVTILFGTADYGRSMYVEFLKVLQSHVIKRIKSRYPHKTYGGIIYPFYDDFFYDVNSSAQFIEDQGLLFSKNYETQLRRGFMQLFTILFQDPMVTVLRMSEGRTVERVDENVLRDAMSTNPRLPPPEDTDNPIKLDSFYFLPTWRGIGPAYERSNTAEYFMENAAEWSARRKAEESRPFNFEQNIPADGRRITYLPSTENFVHNLALRCTPQMEERRVPEFELWDLTTMRPFERSRYESNTATLRN